jgi:two-component system response regulator YesN
MYGVDYYMTKPIDEDELKEAIQNIHQLLDARKLQKQSNEFYQKKARHKIIEEMIKYPDWRDENPEISFEELGMVSHSYQVLILNRFSEDQDVYRDFLKGLDVSPKNKDIEWFQEDGYDILLLQGDQIINRFAAYQGQSRNLTDQSYYIAVGRVVMDAGAIHESYSDAWVTKRRSFFSSEKRFIESIEPGPTPSKSSVMPSLPNSKEVAKTFFEQVVVQKQDDCCGFLEKIFGYIEAENADVNAIKNDLAGIYITISQEFQSEYPHIHFDFMNNNEIINVIQSKHYLFEIIDLICSEVASWMVLTGDVGDDDIIERIVQYVRQHCTEDLKVKNIAQKFGYNRCYLGKIFTHKVGVNFTEYLHGLRIDRAKELLENTSLKMYEIAKMVGYAKADSS